MREGKARPRARTLAVLSGMALTLFGLTVQLIRVQFGPYAPVFAAAEEANAGTEERVAPARGKIYDRSGYLLATNKTLYYLEIDRGQLTNQSRSDIATVLSELLSLPYLDLKRQLSPHGSYANQVQFRLTQASKGTGRLPIMVTKAKADILERFRAEPGVPDLRGLVLVPTQRRVYPAGSIAGHLLGFVNQEGKGFFGVEGYYDEWLAGKPITVRRSGIPLEVTQPPDPPAGVNLVLTIDVDVQYMVERELARTIEWAEAEGGQVVIMDPRNGEILAMAAWPALDPNDYEAWLTAEQEGLVISPAVAGTYEPGSTFKALVMAAAVDARTVQPEDLFVDRGEIEVGGHLIRNWDGEAWGPQNMTDCLTHSLNVCLAHVASKKLGAGLLYSYLEAFEIGSRTGVDLAGEVSGQLRTPGDPGWTEADLGTNSFGQGVSVTPIQLISAVGAVANEGKLVQPHVVRQVVGPQGTYRPGTILRGRPIGAQTAATMTQMLTDSLRGEAARIGVEGYVLAGKTGTAQVPTEFGYDPRATVASFVGWGPVEDPQFIILVRIDRPKISPWGSDVAAPAFERIVERLTVLLQIPPTVDAVAGRSGE